MFKFLFIFILLSFATNAYTQEWKQVGQEDGIIILSQTAQNGILPFKATGMVEDNIESVLKILKDHKHKPEWSPKLDKVKVHKEIDSKNFIFSEYYQTPWPATDREFLLKGEIKSCLLYTSPSPRDGLLSRMPSSA